MKQIILPNPLKADDPFAVLSNEEVKTLLLLEKKQALAQKYQNIEDTIYAKYPQKKQAQLGAPQKTTPTPIQSLALPNTQNT